MKEKRTVACKLLLRIFCLLGILDMTGNENSTVRRKNLGSRWRLRLLLIVFFVLVIMVGFRILGEWRKRQEIEDEISRLSEEAKRLENRNLEILELSKQLTTEEFLEREARLKLGLQKPGESVAILGTNNGSNETVSHERLGASRMGNAQRWLYYFFDQEKLKNLREERKTRRIIPRPL